MNTRAHTHETGPTFRHRLHIHPWLAVSWQLLKTTSMEWWRDDTFRYAAALAFYTLFSLAPVVLMAEAVSSFFFGQSEATQSIVFHVQQVAGDEVANVVREVITASSPLGKSKWVLAIGIVTLIFSAATVFRELQAALNNIWDVQPAEWSPGMMRAYLISRLRSFLIALIVGLLLIVSVVASAVLNSIKIDVLSGVQHPLWLLQTCEMITSLVMVVVLFAMVYKYLPDVRLDWPDVWIGAMVTGLLFTAGKYCLGIYLGRAAIGSTFGTTGSLAVLLVWVYYSALISSFGAEFTRVYTLWRGKEIPPDIHAVVRGKKLRIAPEQKPTVKR